MLILLSYPTEDNILSRSEGIPELQLVADEISVRLISQCCLVGKVMSDRSISKNKVQMSLSGFGLPTILLVWNP